MLGEKRLFENYRLIADIILLGGKQRRRGFFQNESLQWDQNSVLCAGDEAY